MNLAVLAEVVSQGDSIAALVMSVTSVLLLGAGALILDALRRSQRKATDTLEETNAAVHTTEGDPLAQALERFRAEFTSRSETNEARLTDQGKRLAIVEASTATAHRRTDQIDEEIRQVRRDHGERIGAVEQEVAALKGAPCLAPPHPGD